MLSLRTEFVCASGLLFAAIAAPPLMAEEAAVATFRADVDMVTLSFTVTDSRGRYITDLTPQDFKVIEDGVEQTPAAFLTPEENTKSPVPHSVFILMDTSNSMYEEFMHASDTVAKFVHKVNDTHAIAIYTFSRNMFRSAPLGSGRVKHVAALRNSVLGDDTAIFNSLLLTVRDAAKVPGNKSIVLLSNGPDTASIVSPDDVARVAREEGIPVHVVFTTERDEMMSAVFQRIAGSTGGRAYTARTWDQQKAAFNQIQDEILNSYTVAYYPRPTDNEGFRKISIEVSSDVAKRYRISARPGYKPAQRAPECPSCRLARVQAASPAAAGSH